MHRTVTLFVIILLALASASVGAFADNLGAIKRFKSFPVTTYDEFGNYSDTQLKKDTTPDPSLIAVDGWWPDKKMLLIVFGGEGYFVLYSAVEMNEQTYWDGKMAASGGIQCNYGKVAGRAPQTKTAATKRFASPC